MNPGRIITWAMLRTMVSKGNEALTRIDTHSKDAIGSNKQLLMQILQWVGMLISGKVDRRRV